MATAVAVHAGYASLVLEDGVRAPGVSLAGLLSVLFIVGLICGGLVHALTRERRTIAAELSDEREAVMPAQLDLLVHPRRRQLAQVRGSFDPRWEFCWDVSEAEAAVDNCQ